MFARALGREHRSGRAGSAVTHAGGPGSTAHRALPPQLLRRESRTLGHRLELRPDDRGMADTLAESTVRTGDNVLTTDDSRVADQALGDQLRVLDEVAEVADYARNQQLPLGQLHVLPDPPLVLVARVGR